MREEKFKTIVHDEEVTFNVYKALKIFKHYENLYMIYVVESKLIEQGHDVNLSGLEKKVELEEIVLEVECVMVKEKHAREERRDPTRAHKKFFAGTGVLRNREASSAVAKKETAKEMWDKLKVTYEGMSKVKETMINLLVHDYDLFRMKEGEFIEEMFTRFSKIIEDLKAFGRPRSSGEQKTHLKKRGQEEKKKIVSFKNAAEGSENDNDDDAEALEEEISMVSRNMNGLMRIYKNAKKGRMSSRRTRQFNEQDKNDGNYFECGRSREYGEEVWVAYANTSWRSRTQRRKGSWGLSGIKPSRTRLVAHECGSWHANAKGRGQKDSRTRRGGRKSIEEILESMILAFVIAMVFPRSRRRAGLGRLI
nr:uncharacterized protein LOC104091635 [Nicotiana tomentosiformis]